jgi:hypothetical protein
MCRFIFLFLIFALSTRPLLSADEPQIDPSDAPHYIGQSVTVSGLVVVVFVSKQGNVFINFGDKYPNQTFTGWIPTGTPLASDPSLQLLQDKTVKITGTINLYRGKPEIEITSKDQIVSESGGKPQNRCASSFFLYYVCSVPVAPAIRSRRSIVRAIRRTPGPCPPIRDRLCRRQTLILLSSTCRF